MDINILINEGYPSAKDYNFLRNTVGWGTYDESIIDESLKKSLFGIVVENNGKTIGMARVIGDKQLAMYIQDVIVLPEFQGKGIGKLMMKEILNYINNNSVKNTIIGLCAAKGKEPFYEKIGFLKRPGGKYGHGMHLVNK